VKSNNSFWLGKRVLLTGHTGFKGSWLALWLQQLGAQICGISLPPTTNPNLFELARVAQGIDSHFCDIRDAERLVTLVRANRPEIVMHLAAQPLVRKSYREPLATFACNTMGTVHLLDALRDLDSVRVALVVTTDKVYKNLEHPYPYRESDVLGGHDPYSASKAASELVIACYRDAYLKGQRVAVASARAGNVIGGGDWSEDRLIPDAIRVWKTDGILEIRHPQAIRPWQHVLEPLKAYLSLAEQLWNNPSLAGAYNFGPPTHEAISVGKLVELAQIAYGKGNIHHSSANGNPHEAHWLSLETVKARVTLGIEPIWTLTETVARAIGWYKAQEAGADARELCLAEIKEIIKK
jgi:CDP-glucose 4,6-dehydratase